MIVVVDTNVPVVANGQSPQASADCVEACVQRLRQITSEGTLVLDHDFYILGEYLRNLRSNGQPGVGDAFLKWALTNRTNPRRCTLVHIEPLGNSFAEFPDSTDLAGFDLADHKFVAVALAHQGHPPILNAVDSDWWHYRKALESHGVAVEFLCPDAVS